MVFSSVPVYPNWQEHVNQDTGAGGENHPLQSPPPQLGGGSSNGSIRPGSMAERARLAKTPQPEAALKCPRCESTNTKFCYFNNYSLSQPRHFCKTCRRYWTRGGALRNVPVGGGCRRNKRSKGSSRSKSPVKAGSSSSSGLTSNGCSTDIINHVPAPTHQLPILPPLHHLGEYNSGGMGLSFGGIQPLLPVTTAGGGDGDGAEFHIGNTSSSGVGVGGVGSILSSGLVDQWRLQVQQQVQQFPFLANLDQSSGLYSFGSEGIEARHYVGQFRSKPLDTAVTQSSAVKTEEKEGMNLSRNFMGISANDHYWSGNAWNDLPGFTSSSTSHLL